MLPILCLYLFYCVESRNKTDISGIDYHHCLNFLFIMKHGWLRWQHSIKNHIGLNKHYNRQMFDS